MDNTNYEYIKYTMTVNYVRVANLILVALSNFIETRSN